MKKWLRWLILANASLLLAGCVETKVLDDLVIIDGIAFDHADDDRIRVSILSTLYVKDQPPKNFVATTISDMKKMGLEDISFQVPFDIGRGGIDLLLFGEELAKKEGILNLIDPFQRDPAVGASLVLGIVKGDAKSFLEGEYGIRGNATYISRTIENSAKHENLPKTDLQRFLADFYQEGKTPYMPQLKQMSKEKMEVGGVYLISNGKIADYINTNEMFFFKLLVDRSGHGIHKVEIEEGKAAIRNIQHKHTFKLVNNDPYHISVHIKINGSINEFTGNVLKQEYIDKMEKKFEKEINEKCMELINRFKEKELDPVGFGHFAKSKTRHFDQDEWKNVLYKDLKVTVHSDVKIIQTGVIE